MHDALSIACQAVYKNNLTQRVAYRFLGLDVLVDAPGISHIAQHHFADLQCRLPETDLQDLDVTSLVKMFVNISQPYRG